MAEAPPIRPPDEAFPINIEDEMRQAYLDYAMSVIIGRALPDVRDGLKPVHRRVLFAMQDLGNVYNRAYKKSARIVGDVIGKYHPHGDQAVYDTLVRMAQDFSMRYLLVDGQGNFGSIDGDPPAAMRYTESRMTKLSSELLADIDKETVDFTENYDGSLSEPTVLPTRAPNLLINGTTGIAVGMATSIPPHNLREVVDACIHYARDDTATTADLMKYVPAPDFPTGGIIYGTSGLAKAYETGRGSIKVRGRASIEPAKRGYERIVITEIPYMVNKTALIEKIAELVRDRRIEGIRDVRDESDRQGMRVVVELRKEENTEVVLNQLYTNTALQSSFSFNLVAIVKGQPQTLSLRHLIKHFIDHRREVVTRRSRYELREANKRFNVVFGLLAAIDSIDRVIEIIRAAKDNPTAKANLMAEELPMSPAFKKLCEDLITFDYEPGSAALVAGHVRLNETQAQAILDMRLARLTGLERDKLAGEAKELQALIEKLTAILASDALLTNVIVEELEEIKEAYGDERRTQLEHDARQISVEDLIAEEDMVVTVSHMGYVKRSPITTYRAQQRGGKGTTAATTREEDFVETIFVASTHSYVLVFTNKGKVYWLKVHEIPQASRTAKGKPIVNLIKIAKDDHIAAVLPIRAFVEGSYLVFATAKGFVKKTDLMEYSNPRPSGLIATNIDDDDSLIRVGLTDGNQEVLIATARGISIRFSETDVREMGRSARGVRAIKLKKAGDSVVGMVIPAAESTHILTVTEKGSGKRTALSEYRLQGRGGSGIINAKVSDARGPIVGITAVSDDDEVMIVTDRGMMIRIAVSEIPQYSRQSQGVRVIKVRKNEKVVSVARIVETDDEALEK